MMCSKTESGSFGKQMSGRIIHVDFLENKIVGIDEKTTKIKGRSFY